jgi:2-oxoglutarate ferredoxin oxidoreductase subunit beta
MILINNGIYGMTGGQVSPLTPPKFFTETTPYGNIEPHFNVRKLLTAAEASFVARETVNRLMQLKQVIKKSFQHKGFSVVEVMSNCHVNLGRRNKMKSPLVMTKYIKDITMPMAEFEKLSPEEQAPKYPLGIFVENTQRMEYTDLYYNHIVPVAQQSGAKGEK